MTRYELTWEDGYELIVLGNKDDLVDVMINHQSHGNVTSIYEEISYNKYTGAKRIRLA